MKSRKHESEESTSVTELFRKIRSNVQNRTSKLGKYPLIASIPALSLRRLHRMKGGNLCKEAVDRGPQAARWPLRPAADDAMAQAFCRCPLTHLRCFALYCEALLDEQNCPGFIVDLPVDLR